MTVRPARFAARMRRSPGRRAPTRTASSSSASAAPRPSARCDADRPAPPAASAPAAGRGCGPARGGGGPTPCRASPPARLRRARATSPTVGCPRRAASPPSPGPTPHSRSTGSGCRNVELPPGRHQEQPVGLRDPLATFARNLVLATPTVIASPTSSRTRAPQLHGDLERRAGDPPQPAHVEERLVDRDPLDHRRGVVEDLEDRLARLRVGRIRGGTTTACGHSRRACRAAHRACDPERLGLVARGEHHARRRRSPAARAARGSSRCSTDAKNESRSAWRIEASPDTNTCSHSRRTASGTVCARTRAEAPSDS